MIILAEAEANIWTALPTILWVALIAAILSLLRTHLSQLISHLVTRVRAGAPMKIGSVEFGALHTELHQMPTAIDECSSAHQDFVPMTPAALDINGTRLQHYNETRRIMLVHRLFLSSRPNQVYDVLIYLVPHYEGSLVGVTGVEYFFGGYWANKVFESYDRSHGFPILTSAYGTFLCCARLSFNDGTKQNLFRYIDFEMGAYAPVLTNK